MQQVVVCLREEEERDDRLGPERLVRYADQRGMKEFMSTIDVFLKLNARKLSSFTIMFQLQVENHWKIGLLKENGLRMPHNAFFQSVAELLENDRVSDEYSEGLELCLEFGYRHPVRYNCVDAWDERQFWEQIETHCSLTNDRKLNVEHWRGSEDIIQLICEILNKGKKNRRGDKLIVKCTGIDMTAKCKEFLRFWIPGDNIAIGWNQIEFVVQ